MSDINADPRYAGGKSQFDAVVEKWNKHGVHERAAIRRECTQRGHDWRDVVSEGQVIYVVCARCCEYNREAPTPSHRV